MPFKRQFTVGAIFVFVAIVAIALRPGAVITLLLIEGLAVVAAATILVRNLPVAIRRKIEANCRRSDGTRSRRREYIERLALRKVTRDVCLLLVLILLPTNAAIWYVNAEVIPISIGTNALVTMGFHGDATKLHDEEHAFDRWWYSNHIAGDLGARKRLLMHAWPLVLIGGVIWLGVSFAIFSAAYFRVLQDLLSSIEYRHQKYVLHDLHRSTRRQADSEVGQTESPSSDLSGQIAF